MLVRHKPRVGADDALVGTAGSKILDCINSQVAICAPVVDGGMRERGSLS